MQNIQEEGDYVEASCYYLLPCFFMFDRSHRLLDLVLMAMASLVQEHTTSVSSSNNSGSRLSSKIVSIVEVLLLMHREAKIWRLVCSSKDAVAHILRSIQSLLVIGSNLAKLKRFNVFSLTIPTLGSRWISL